MALSDAVLQYHFATAEPQMLTDYDARTDFQPVYEGYAMQNVATSTAGWIIKKNFYNSDGSFDKSETVTKAVWDLRNLYF